MIRLEAHRIDAGSGAPSRAQRAGAGNTTGRWQDKRAHIAPRLSGWFCWPFRHLSHLAAIPGNVQKDPNPFYPNVFSHIAGQCRGR